MLARGVVGERFERRLLRRVLQGQDVAVDLAVLRRFLPRPPAARPKGPASGALSVDKQRARLGGGEQLLGEGGLKRAQPLVHRLQLRLLGGGKLGAGVHELLVIDVEQLGLLGVEVQLGLVVVEILDAGEQLGVEVDEVVVRGEQRRGLGVGRLQRVVGVGAIDCGEGEDGAFEQRPEFSSATSVLSNVGAAFWLAIAVTSRFCWPFRQAARADSRCP